MQILGGQNYVWNRTDFKKMLNDLSDGSKIQATIYIPKPTKPIFPEQMERNIIENFNKSQPLAVNKVVKCHIMRN